jgi:phage-related tail fiber protein
MLTCGTAAADTIVVTGIGLGDSNFYLNENGTDKNVSFAGIIDIRLTETGISGTFDRTTLCVQLFTDISENTTYNTTVLLPSHVTPPPTVASLQQIAWLLDNETPTTSDLAAGLQLAIWKIAEDGLYTGGSNPFTTGTVRQATSHTTPAAILSDAQTYLTASIGHSSDLAFVYVNVTQATPPVAAQMLEGLKYPTGPGSTPESSTFMLAGVALLALGHTARRKLGSR